MNRNTATAERHRRITSRGHPPCHVCGNDIDYNAPHLDPLSFTIDHITPLNRGGTDTLDNIAPAHRQCNRMKSDRIPGITYVTDRIW